jgi:hypothetical protein
MMRLARDILGVVLTLKFEGAEMTGKSAWMKATRLALVVMLLETFAGLLI